MKSSIHQIYLTSFISQTIHTPKIRSSKWKNTFLRFVLDNPDFLLVFFCFFFLMHFILKNLILSLNRFSYHRNWNLNWAVRCQYIFCVVFQKQHIPMFRHTSWRSISLNWPLLIINCVNIYHHRYFVISFIDSQIKIILIHQSLFTFSGSIDCRCIIVHCIVHKQ